MQLSNQTLLTAVALPTFITRKRSILTVVVKGTFSIVPNERAPYAEEQLPIFFGDEYHDPEKGGSVKFEADTVPFKRRADIILVGSAHAPLGRPVHALKVGLRVGPLIKTAHIFGDRHWQDIDTANPILSLPEPFTVMPLRYENAFGGMDPDTGTWCQENPVGRGFLEKRSKQRLAAIKLPNIENDRQLIQSWDDRPAPVGFGFIGKNWQPRVAYLGTYDEQWQQERCPDPPRDFNADFYNGAPPDQQLKSYLQGDEVVDLRNLAPTDRLRFYLPGLKPQVSLSTSNRFDIAPGQTPAETTEALPLHLDTLCMMPDQSQFYLVWRGFRYLQDMTAREIDTVTVTLAD